MAAHRILVGGAIGLIMTPNWDLLLDETSLASLLPLEYAYLARPVRDGLTVFLSGLPAEDQAEMLRAQTGLPPTATISQRLGLLLRGSPVLQKLGQILARDPRLLPELRSQLRQLESLPPTVPPRVIQEILTQELGPLDRRGVTLVPPAIAEASVAVVIPFRENGSETPGVFKVLKPGIQERLGRELVLLGRVGEHLDERCDELRIPHLDYRESFQQVRDKLRDEVHLENEQRHLKQAKAFFADESRVQIPELLDHCTTRVTAMERVTGGKVTGHRLNSASKRRRLARLVGKALIAKPIFSKNHAALFHGDPHAGNLFLTDDGRLAILDWSLVGVLGEPQRVAIVQVMLGAITLDSRRIVSVLQQIADPLRLDSTALSAVVQDRIRQVRHGRFPGLNWLVGMLDDATQRARLRVGADLMLLRKSLLTLEGVIAEVGDSSGQLDSALSREFLRHFAVEWPQRWTRFPQSRDFATRLSNLDLAHTILSTPAAVARFWTGRVADVVAPRNGTIESTETIEEQSLGRMG